MCLCKLYFTQMNKVVLYNNIDIKKSPMSVKLFLYEMCHETLYYIYIILLKLDNEVPLDGKKRDILVLYIPEYAFLPLALLSFFGLVSAAGFLIFNIRKRDLK